VYGGVETGGTWTVCALGTGPGEVAEREQFRTTTPEETLDRVAGFFEEHGRPQALGIGSFGPLDLDPASPTWGWIRSCPKPGWQHVPVAPRLADRLEIPVALDTDVAAAAVAEHRWGAGRDLPSLCYLTVGTGIGGALLLDGRPWHGLMHPEVGHLRVPHDRTRDPFGGNCPVHGDCWEGLASGAAVAERWSADGAGLPDDHEAWALEVEYLALGILAIAAVASPHRVIAGGGVLERPGLRDRVGARLRELNADYLPLPDGFLAAPALGDDAGVLGALALAEMSG
jgi:fructokinase